MIRLKIGLIDVDGHNFPNLALMRISSYHKAKGDDVILVDTAGRLHNKDNLMEELKKLLNFVIDQFDLDLYDKCDFIEEQDGYEQSLRELENQEYYLSVLRSLE